MSLATVEAICGTMLGLGIGSLIVAILVLVDYYYCCKKYGLWVIVLAVWLLVGCAAKRAAQHPTHRTPEPVCKEHFHCEPSAIDAKTGKASMFDCLSDQGRKGTLTIR